LDVHIASQTLWDNSAEPVAGLSDLHATRHSIKVPHAISRRAREIKAACGFPGHSWPFRPLHDLSPAERCALRADSAMIMLHHARAMLDFLRLRRSASVASLRWYYRAYARDKATARRFVRMSGQRLAEAETMFAALRQRRAVA
jgi:hypothetical protein